MTILFGPQGTFGWFSYTTSRDTIFFLSTQSFFDFITVGIRTGHEKIPSQLLNSYRTRNRDRHPTTLI